MKRKYTNILLIDDNQDCLAIVSLLDAYSGTEETLKLVLWQRDGLFRLIPETIVNNAIHAYDNWVKMSHPIGLSVSIRWEQGVDVDPKIARILLGE